MKKIINSLICLTLIIFTFYFFIFRLEIKVDNKAIENQSNVGDGDLEKNKDDAYNLYCARIITPEYNEIEIINNQTRDKEKGGHKFSDEEVKKANECVSKKTSTILKIANGEFNNIQFNGEGTSNFKLIEEQDVVTITLNDEVYKIDNTQNILVIRVRFGDYLVVESSNPDGVYYYMNDFFEHDQQGNLISSSQTGY